MRGLGSCFASPDGTREQMDGKRLIHSLKLTNFLSFGPGGTEIALEPLNVLIGPNASGKSNFIEAFALLHALPRDLAAAVRVAGGAGELIWKGGSQTDAASIEVTVASAFGLRSLQHYLAFARLGQGSELVSEVIAPVEASAGLPPVYYELQTGSPTAATIYAKNPDGAAGPDGSEWIERPLRLPDLSLLQSILSQRRDTDVYPALAYLAKRFEAIRFFRKWELGTDAAPRKPCRTDDPKEFLLEDASNLGMVLNDLQNRPDVRDYLRGKLKRFHERADNVTLNVLGNTIEIRLHEQGIEKPIPASRLSDGTLRYLCLLAILCHPEPPPLVVIEEPELGLHPDALGALADFLIEASQRMQIIVTTHSDLLVSRFTELPEAVVICERDDDGTRLERLERDRLKSWLEKYSLGELWLMGEIGGTL